MIQVTGLWEYERQGGGKYYSARIGNIKLLLFPVDRRTDKSPAFDLYVTKWEARNDNDIDTSREKAGEKEEG